MRIFRTAAALAALSLVATPAAAQGGLPCLSASDAQDVVAFVLPSAIDAAAAACAPTLPPGSFLTGSTRISDRYRSESARAWPGAKRAFGRVSQDKLGSLLGDDTLRRMATDLVGKMVAGEIKPETCGAIDRLVAAMEPLPARSAAQLMVALLDISGKDRKLPVQLCRPPAAR